MEKLQKEIKSFNSNIKNIQNKKKRLSSYLKKVERNADVIRSFNDYVGDKKKTGGDKKHSENSRKKLKISKDMNNSKTSSKKRKHSESNKHSADNRSKYSLKNTDVSSKNANIKTNTASSKDVFVRTSSSHNFSRTSLSTYGTPLQSPDCSVSNFHEHSNLTDTTDGELASGSISSLSFYSTADTDTNRLKDSNERLKDSYSTGDSVDANSKRLKRSNSKDFIKSDTRIIVSSRNQHGSGLNKENGDGNNKPSLHSGLFATPPQESGTFFQILFSV